MREFIVSGDMMVRFLYYLTIAIYTYIGYLLSSIIRRVGDINKVILEAFLNVITTTKYREAIEERKSRE